jgi:hypothetical protein
MFGAFTDQVSKFFDELMAELKGIRAELSAVRSLLESQQGHPAIRPPAAKRPAARKQP